MAILKAKHVVVDEAGLTGEVNPIAKIPLNPLNPDLTYEPNAHKSSTIFAGTSILECGGGVGMDSDLAIITQTGSFTSKGVLLSDVLSYEDHLYKFNREMKMVMPWYFVLLYAFKYSLTTSCLIYKHRFF